MPNGQSLRVICNNRRVDIDGLSGRLCIGITLIYFLPS